MGARTQSKACKDHRADAEEHGFNIPGRLTHGLRRWFNSACRNASARTEVVELMTHNAKGEEISGVYQWRRWESNPKRSDTLTLRGHSVFPRIAIKRTEPDLLLPYPAVPWNPLTCPALWSLL